MIRLLQTIPALCLVLVPAMATADEIKLSFGDTVALIGNFAGFQDDAYIIFHNDQKLHVPAKLVTCEGADCLNFEPISDIALASGDL